MTQTVKAFRYTVSVQLGFDPEVYVAGFASVQAAANYAHLVARRDAEMTTRVWDDAHNYLLFTNYATRLPG